jgi:hypothetical protein
LAKNNLGNYSFYNHDFCNYPIHRLNIQDTEIVEKFRSEKKYIVFSKTLLKTIHFWSIMLCLILFYSLYIFYLKNDAQRTPENVVKAYYDAIDYKEYEKSYELLDPKSNVSLSQYMLEISVYDGLLSSYARLDALETKSSKKTDSLVILNVQTSWITPLEKINKNEFKTLVNRNGKWFLKLEKEDSDIPPDQLYSNNIIGYYNQGRRKITTEQTHHEDVLKQPVLEIITAKLVKFNNRYAIIGEIQNIDNTPADIVLKGTLYNDENKELATYNAKYHIKHKLMPKEISSFRINFEGIAWSKTQDSIPKTFNPDEFTPIELKEQPTRFNLQAAGNVSYADLYKNVVLSNVEVDLNTIKGTLFNSGLQEITIPQLLITYYDKEKTLVWVDHLFIENGIKQQRKQYFEYNLIESDQLTIINKDMRDCYVNGLSNALISNKIVPNRIFKHTDNELQNIDHPFYKYVKIEMNPYIGKPKQ